MTIFRWFFHGGLAIFSPILSQKNFSFLIFLHSLLSWGISRFNSRASWIDMNFMRNFKRNSPEKNRPRRDSNRVPHPRSKLSDDLDRSTTVGRLTLYISYKTTKSKLIAKLVSISLIQSWNSYFVLFFNKVSCHRPLKEWFWSDWVIQPCFVYWGVWYI